MPLNYFRLRSLLALMVIVLVSASIITYLAGRHVISSNQQVIQHLTVIQQLQQTLSTLKDAETGQRGFLLTGNDKYLQPYNDAVDTINLDLAQLQQQSDAGFLPAPTVAKIASLTNDKLAELNHTIDLRRNNSFEAAQAVVNSDVGQNIMDDLRNIIDQSISEKESTLQTLRHSADIATASRTFIFLATTGLELLFCFWAYARIVSEIERRTAAFAETRRQKDLLSVTLSSIGDAVLITDVDSRITFMNAIAETLTGWSLAEARGKPAVEIFNIINEESRNIVESPIEKVLRTGLVVGLANHTLLIRKDGSEIPIDDSGAPIRDESGQIYGVVLVFRDFSEHKNAERSLLQAKAEAEAANRAQRPLHRHPQPRTPHTPFPRRRHPPHLGSQRRPPRIHPRRRPHAPPKRRPRSPPHRRPPRPHPHLQGQTLTQPRNPRLPRPSSPPSVGIIPRRRLRKTPATLLTLDARNHFVRADSARLQQVMWNVLKNAVKFTPAGGSISIHTSDLPDASITLNVTDTGIGMSSDTLSRLFKPFEQGDSDTKRLFGGLGLGMSIAKALIEAQNGAISASSDGTDKGASFSVSLPTVPKLLLSGTGIPSPNSSPTRALQILLVEDHPDTARVMNRILASLGHQVRIADSVASALSLVRAHPFDLLLSDLGLPDGTGLELVKQVHAHRYVPAIALTGFGMEDDISRSREAGFTSHLTKPINFQKLEAAILLATEPQTSPS